MAIYTPQLSKISSATLRRMAWAGRVTMTKAIDEAILIISGLMDKSAVCSECKRREAVKCEDCFFNNNDEDEMKF